MAWTWWRRRHENFKIVTGAWPDVERIKTIWTGCLESYGGQESTEWALAEPDEIIELKVEF